MLKFVQIIAQDEDVVWGALVNARLIFQSFLIKIYF